MGDGLWNRQQQQHQLGPSGGVHKRPRSDYGQEMHGYFAREDDLGGPRTVKDNRSIGSAYDRYLQNAEMASYTSGEASTFGGAGMGRAVGGGMTGPPMADHSMRGRPGAMSSDVLTNGRNMNLANQLPVDSMPRPGRETVPLPLDASSTLYVEGLPPDSTRREVAHIFRHFVGYKAVRLVNEESGLSIMQRGGDPLILCFVDFENPTHAATALSALQGYEMDEQAPDSNYLRLQFYQFPDPRAPPPFLELIIHIVAFSRTNPRQVLSKERTI
ncbi:unnamed protein product [Malus baccata var. baccata]